MEIIRQNSLCFIIMPTYECNLLCDYCFSERRKQKLNSQKLDELFIKIKDICKKMYATKISFYWIGGEVFTLGVDWFENMDKKCKNIFNNSNSGKEFSIKHHIQSNIVLYNSNWKNVISRIFHGSIGSSLDYPNIFRKEKNKTPEDFVELWLEKRNEIINDGFRVGVISLPNKKTIEIGADKFYDFYFNKIGIKSIQINNPYTVDFQKDNYTLDIEKYTQFMVDLFKIWWEKGLNKGIIIKPFKFFIDMITNPNKELPCLWSPECGSGFFSIGPNGEIGLCDSIVSNYPELHYGNIFTDDAESIINHTNRINFIKRSEKILDSECNDCPYCTICFGGCVTRAYPSKHNVFDKDIYCETFKELFRTIEYYSRSNKISKK